VFITLTLSLICFFVYVLSYELMWRLSLALVGKVKFDVAWGLTVRYSIVVFTTISMIINSIIVFWPVFEIKKNLLIHLVAILTFSLFFLDVVNIYPFRVGMLIGSALIANMVGGWVAWRVLKNILMKDG